MSQMKEWFEKVAKDGELQVKYVEIIRDSWESGEDVTYKNLIDFAKDTGYDITIDEMKQYFKEIAASQEGELPDSELDKVSGGLIRIGPGVPRPGGPEGPGYPFPGGPGVLFPVHRA